ncbi:MAG: hypothetical protein R6X08_12460 [Desulfosalsimonadaceae bacterium]
MTIWGSDIQTFIDLEIDGADFYQLNVFNKSPLAEAVEEGRLPLPAGLAEQAHMFARGVEMMEHRRCRRLSMSHWASSNRERNMYNQLMKSGAPCLPFGAGAGGTLRGYLCMVQGDLDLYLSGVTAGRKPISAMLAAPPQKPLINDIASGLETGYLDPKLLHTYMDREVLSRSKELKGFFEGRRKHIFQASRLNAAMGMAAAQIINSPYTGQAGQLFYESKALELLSLKLDALPVPSSVSDSRTAGFRRGMQRC